MPTRIKAFRLSNVLLENLTIAAGRQGVTESAFVANILSKRLEIDPLLPTLSYVALDKAIFGSILGTCNSHALEIAGFEFGKRNFMLVKELFASSGINFTFTRYVKDILDKQGRWFKTEGATRKPDQLTLYHGYGPKWSLFLRAV